MHSHSHDDNGSARIGWAFFLNVGFTIIEFVGGILTNSTAIMADAVHDLGDSISIGLAWVLAKLGNRPASQNFSYGYKRLSLLGSLINGIVLIAGSAWVLYQSIPRLFDPEMPVTEGMLALSIFGIAVNGFAAFKLSKGKTLNEKVLNWHLLEDVLGWVAVFIVSVVLMFVEWPILDPILAIGFTLFILFNVIRNVGTTLKLFLQGVPDKNLARKIERKLKDVQEFQRFHHLHLWSLDGEHHVLTVHIELEADVSLEDQRDLKRRLSQELAEFDLSHTTVEFELYNEPCRDHSI
ncbi:cation diffusion facilitator family transporter [Halioxenophilus aromaticivorans]|uniref:Cation diffusion facilitator family transporter n=1 Tax=Halioxenophilus aromaticivorans TaxID=1306992 RepID=A0AAV3U3B0_9ALTE